MIQANGTKSISQAGKELLNSVRSLFKKRGLSNDALHHDLSGFFDLNQTVGSSLLDKNSEFYVYLLDDLNRR